MTRHATILIVDDDSDVLTAARLLLQQHFGRVLTTEDPADIESITQNERIDVFLIDMNFAIGRNTGAEGLEWLRKILAVDPDAVVILMTAFGDLNMAVTAMREGARDSHPPGPRGLGAGRSILVIPRIEETVDVAIAGADRHVPSVFKRIRLREP